MTDSMETLYDRYRAAVAAESEAEAAALAAAADVILDTLPAPAPQAAAIDPGDSWALAAAVLPETRNLLLYGPPGTGKSTFACTHGADPFKPQYRLYVSEEMPASEIRGGPLPTDEGWKWSDGPAVLAWRHGARLVIDEIDKASADAFTLLLSICDDAAISGFVLPNGEHVKPAEGFHVIATSNVSNPAELPPALADRFTVAIRITEPHPAALRALPEDLRAAAKGSCNAAPHLRVSLRGWQMFAHLRERIGVAAAARAVFGDRGPAIMDSFAVAQADGPVTNPCHYCGTMTDVSLLDDVWTCKGCRNDG